MSLLRELALRPGDVVSLVGGGGKTSLGLRLVREAAEAGWRAIFTVTTRIYPVPLPTVTLAEFDPAAGGPWPVCVVGGDAVDAAGAPGSGATGKLVGIPAEAVDGLIRCSDLVVVEADGSAGRPLKFPLAHEPVIPPSTAVVLAVAGAAVVGRPLGPDWVHRPAEAAGFLGVPVLEPVTPGMVARILVGPATRGRPPGARVVPVINQADSPARLAAARLVAGELAALGVLPVLLTSAQSPHPVIERRDA